jgi:hypothetical protein
MVIPETPPIGEASQEEASHFADLLQAKFPPPPADRKPEGYYYPTFSHRDNEAELIKSGQFAPDIMGLSERLIKQLVTASGERIELSVMRGITVDPDTQQPSTSGGVLVRYKALYPDSKVTTVDTNTIDSNGVVEAAGDKDKKGFVVDIYEDGHVDAWHGLSASHTLSRQGQVYWLYSHQRASSHQVFEYYNDIELARETFEPQH